MTTDQVLAAPTMSVGDRRSIHQASSTAAGTVVQTTAPTSTNLAERQASFRQIRIAAGRSARKTD